MTNKNHIQEEVLSNQLPKTESSKLSNNEQEILAMITSGGIDVDQILEYDSNLTLEDLKSYLVDIFFDRDDQASNQCFKGAQERHIVAYHCCGHTGQLQEIPYMGDRVEGTTCAGCQMFHEALAKEASSFLTLDTQFTNKKKYGD